jgi:hypothetical protein
MSGAREDRVIITRPATFRLIGDEELVVSTNHTTANLALWMKLDPDDVICLAELFQKAAKRIEQRRADVTDEP